MNELKGDNDYFFLLIMSQTLMAGCDSRRCLENERRQNVLKSHTVQLYGRLKRTLIPPETRSEKTKKRRERREKQKPKQKIIEL